MDGYTEVIPKRRCGKGDTGFSAVRLCQEASGGLSPLVPLEVFVIGLKRKIERPETYERPET